MMEVEKSKLKGYYIFHMCMKTELNRITKKTMKGQKRRNWVHRHQGTVSERDCVLDGVMTHDSQKSRKYSPLKLHIWKTVFMA